VAFTRYGAEIAAIVGLFTIAGFLWRIFKSLGATMRVVVTLPAQVNETNKKVDAANAGVTDVSRKVDILTVQHAEEKEQTHTALVRLEGAHDKFDNRLRGVESGVDVLRDRKERGPPDES
jgi:hypothetical protein